MRVLHLIGITDKKQLIDLLLENYGKKILRKNDHDRWVETNLNDTYLELIIEFPEDYALPFSNLYSNNK